MRYRYRFIQFKKRQPEKFNFITNRILLDLTNLEKAIKESNDTGPCALEANDGIILNINILYM
jgi:hypothetical protein